MTPVDEETSRPVDYTEKGSIAIITLNRPERLNTLTEVITRHTEEAYRWVESFEAKGFGQVVAERDEPFGDYGAADRG